MILNSSILLCNLLLFANGLKLITFNKKYKYAFTIMSSVSPPEEKYVSTAPTVLRCDKLCKSYTGIPQFQDISFALGKGQRIGLIGVNGAGKSTLLKCLAKLETPDSGEIDSAKMCNIIYVDQEPEWGKISVYEALFSGTSDQAQATRQYFTSLDPGTSNHENAQMFTDATEAVENAQAWDYQTLGLTIAEKLNIKNEMLYRDVSTLSGGERKRIGLSAALLKQPDILLLDEPTNHLDIEALEWLSDYLKPGGGQGKDKDMAMILVTHDRFFLEKACSEILELDRASIYRYPGNYLRYLELKEARLNAEDSETDRARTKLRRESEWMKKQPRARQSKSKARQDQFYELVERAKGREEVKKIELASQEEKDNQKRLGGVVAEFSAATFNMKLETKERYLLKDFTYSFRQRDRIGIVGPNGVGKSTFLRILTGSLPLASGSMRLGETLRIGYYEQMGLKLSPEQEKLTVLKFIQDAVEKVSSSLSEGGYNPPSPVMKVSQVDTQDLGRRKRNSGKEGAISVSIESNVGSGASSAVSEAEARSLLSRFQFPSKRWYDRIDRLSGGERKRLQLLQVLAKQPNFLILDEPSNDLDLQTLSALEEYLTEVFNGCLVVVSHDQFFMNRVTEHLFVFEGGGVVKNFDGTYSDYLDFRKEKGNINPVEEEEEEEMHKEAEAKAEAEAEGEIATQPSVKVNQKKNDISSSSKKEVLNPSDTSKVKTTKNKPKISMADRKEYNKLLKEIERLEDGIKELEMKLASPETAALGYTALATVSKEVSSLKDRLSAKEEAWLELSDKYEI